MYNRGRDRGGYGQSRGGLRGRGGGGRGASQAPEIHKSSTLAQPSTAVQATEDKALQSQDLGLERLKLDADPAKLPLRPGYGTKGVPVILWANYFELKVPTNLPLYRYSIDFIVTSSETKPAGAKARWLVQLLLEQALPRLGNHLVTDFRNTIISTINLGLTQNFFDVRYRAEGEDEPRADAKIYRLEVKPTAENSNIHLSDLVDFVTSSNLGKMYVGKNDAIQALNIIIGHYLKQSAAVLSVGANKHFPITGNLVEKWTLGAGLEAFRGFFFSVRAATARVLLNVQVKHAACYEAIRLDLMIEKYFPYATTRDLYKLELFLKTVRVQATHINRRNTKAKTIFGLAKKQDGRGLDHPPQVPTFGAGASQVRFYLRNNSARPVEGSSNRGAGGHRGVARGGRKRGRGNRSGQPLFPRDDDPPPAPATTVGDGRYITVAEYFQSNYGALEKPYLPVLNVGTDKNPSYLPPEVCVILSGRAYNSKLSPDQTANMIKFAVRRPNQNASSIVTNGVSLAGANTNPPMEAFGLSFANSLITVPGRVLNGPTVHYRGKGQAQTKFGSWNMRDIQFTQGSTLPTWSYLWLAFPGQGGTQSQQQAMITRFYDMLRKCGINAPHPLPGLPVMLKGGMEDEDAIDIAFDRVAKHTGKPLLILIILPRNDTALYNRVKLMGDIRYGVHTICVVAAKFTKSDENNNAQYLANVALKFNLKLGGLNQSLEGARLGIIGEGKTMVVGLDVTHPSPGSLSTAPSVAAIVASVDRFLGQWPADVRIQEARKEMVTDLADLFLSRLRLWQKKNKALPENILVYRDGVSETQYDDVLDKELPEFRAACKQIYPATDTKKQLPYISIIIVGKRHNTRFYPTKADDADRSGNPQNGTVVDRGVTEAGNWDFFLQSHTALQGTARPAHYYVVYDEIFKRQKKKAPFEHAADMLEDLTHNMCYMFGRATKAVSICPPAYYADLVCDRARRWLSGVFEASTASSSVGEEGDTQSVYANDARVHERLKDTMFYI